MTGFGAFVRSAHERGELVVQPRMGMGAPDAMRAGLAATRAADATTVGTLTLDSYTRVGDLDAAAKALQSGIALNGYPIVTHEESTTRQVLAGIVGDDFPVQVRHGSATPLHIFGALTRVGLDATEGGPVSYCLPYGRIPLDQSVSNWARCCDQFAGLRELGLEPHLETFGGCMLGQLCPPSQLVAISVLEALFFRQHGIRSISLSYAQQTHPEQDREAVRALRRLHTELLPDADCHIVIYAYMGVYPTTPEGAHALLGRAAELAVATGAERLIVKTAAEAHHIPTVADNVAALEHAAAVARAAPRPAAVLPAAGGPAAAGVLPAAPEDHSADSVTHAEARALVEAVMNCGPDIGSALFRAFKRGYLDIPYCLHPDNMGRSRSYIDDTGRLRWADTGMLPLGNTVKTGAVRAVSSSELLTALSYVQRTYDALAFPESAGPAPLSGPRGT
ncbi:MULTISPECIES: methylaspartate mutase [Streptomyces]|uniref:Methylaspartate mutase n=1 Tax=Streptomyces liliifuscus TaxID=2797636 RepID=A0A7T7L248_9ACTN|nr:methylaspartate mutase [Streptomyces liliifuscus]QQM45065.1 methylaspartate mutase [Streptomyces liliifuscus]